MKPEKITFQTADDVTIVGDWYRGTGNQPQTALLIHMMPADRTSWTAFAGALQEEGWNALAIDLRGHGESTRQGETILDYKKFSDAEHQASQQDIDAALGWLERTEQISADRIIPIGASIGANLSLQTLQRSPTMRGAVLLSPGLDYRGVITEPLVRSLGPEQKIFIAASDDDPESFESSKTLAAALGARGTFQKQSSAGHGTTMLVRNPRLQEEILTWLQQLFP
jgi:pimeloyl-ACP methyl ester carboxylesterase